MAIVVNSPHTGRAVKVREQDVGRAVRDEQGKVFYVLPRGEGGGYFGSRTRAGGAKEERHADAVAANPPAVPPSADTPADRPHDATGKRRAGSRRGKLVILLLTLLVLLFAYLFSPFGPFGWSNMQRGQTPPPNPLPALPQAPPN